jgi:hypothetical protein
MRVEIAFRDQKSGAIELGRRPVPNGGQRPGWPPGRTGRFRINPVASDDLVLTILWTLVVAGLVLLGLFALSDIFGWASWLW